MPSICPASKATTSLDDEYEMAQHPEALPMQELAEREYIRQRVAAIIATDLEAMLVVSSIVGEAYVRDTLQLLNANSMEGLQT